MHHSTCFVLNLHILRMLSVLIISVTLQLIALLTRHHRKKFPGSDHSNLKEIPEEVSYTHFLANYFSMFQC